MAALTLRVLSGTLGTQITKGSPLTHAEMDQNWLNLDAETHQNITDIAALQASTAQFELLLPTPGTAFPTAFTTGTLWFDTASETLYCYSGSRWVNVGETVQTVAPPNPTEGDTYYDPGTSMMYMWSNGAWETISAGAEVTGVQPASPIIGDLWFDTNTNELKVWNGTSWNVSSGTDGYLDPQAANPTFRDGVSIALQDGDMYYNTTDKVYYQYNQAANSWLQLGLGNGGANLGPFTTGGQPTTRNDGSPLKDGDTYYNTTTKELMVYDSAAVPAWQSSNVDAISDLDDVDTTGLAAGDKLVYNGTTWVASDAAGVPNGAAGGEPASPNVGDLYYNTTTGELTVWNGTAWESANVDVISDLDDVNTTGGIINGQALVWDGANWVPGSGGSPAWLDAAAAEPATRADGTAIQEGDTYYNTTDDVLYSWDGTQWKQMSGGSTLGGKAADPTTRDDGSALQAGDTYYNTTTNELMVYDGAAFRSSNVDVISDLDDVDTTGAADGDHLVYENATSTWKAVTPSTNVTIPNGPTGSEPASPVAGDLYFDTTKNELVVWDGAAWSSSNADVISDLDDVDTTGVTSGDKLVWNGISWVPTSKAAIPNGATGSEPTPAAVGDLYYDTTLDELMVYDGTWNSVNVDAISDLDDVNTAGVVNGDHLVYDGVNWVPKASNGGAILTAQTPAPTARDDSSALQEGDQYYDTATDIVYFYNGTSWVASDVTIASVSFDNTTTHDITDATTRAQNGNLVITLNDATPSTFTVDMDGRYVQTVNGVFVDGNGNVPVSLTSVEVGDTAAFSVEDPGDIYGLGTYGGTPPPTDGVVWVVAGDADPNENGKTYIWSATSGAWYQVVGYDQAAMDIRYVNHTEGLGALNDVTTTAPANEHLLQFNGTAWVNVAPNSLALGSIDTHSDVNTTTTPPTANQTLIWNGANWVPADVIASSVINGPTGSRPATPALGDMYYDTTTGELIVWNGSAWESVNNDVLSDNDDVDTTGAVAGDHFVYDGAAWKPVTPSSKITVPSGATGSEPTSPAIGDLYYDTTTNQLMVHDGTNWVASTVVNDGTLTLNIGAAGATGSSVTVATGTGFSADVAANQTYSLAVGPALTDYATKLTGAKTGSGLLQKSAADTVVQVADGTNGQVLTTDGAGALSWTTAAAGLSVAFVTAAGLAAAIATAGTEGDELYVSSDGTSAGTITSRYVYDGTGWILMPAGGAQYVDDLLDADTTTLAPTANASYLMWNGTNWVPSNVTDGSPDGGATDDF